MTTVKYRTILEGTEITRKDETTTFTLENKVEKIYSLLSADSPEVLDFSNITNMKFLQFDGSTSFTVIINITYTQPEDFIIYCDGSIPFTLPADNTFMSSINSISIAPNGSDVSVSVRAYGEAPTT